MKRGWWSANSRCVTYCSEPTTGLSRARNMGLRRATCEIVAWTDDDAVVHPSWIHAIRQVFSDSTISGMTGLVMPAELETASQNRFERDFGGFNRGYRQLDYDFQFFSEMREERCAFGKLAPGPTWRSAVMSSTLWILRRAPRCRRCRLQRGLRDMVSHPGESAADLRRTRAVWHTIGSMARPFAANGTIHARPCGIASGQFEKFHDFGNLRRLSRLTAHSLPRLATAESMALRGDSLV